MKHYRLDEMRGGWYVGDFQPLAYLWQNGEVAIKHYPKRHTELSYLHERAKKLYVIISGRIILNGKIIKTGECAMFAEGEDVSLAAMEDSVVLLVVIGDKTFSRTNLHSLSQILNTYQPLVKFENYTGSEISFSDISVVVQGSVSASVTPLCIESIRKFLPGSKIILSTWEGEKVDSLDVDEIVLSKDPGCVDLRLAHSYEYINYGKLTLPNNINRQILSSKNGIKKVSSAYVLKMRSDMIILSNGFLNYFNKYPLNGDEYRIFAHKIIVPDFFTRHVFRYTKEHFPTPFHPSDWFAFGFTEDVKNYYSVPFMTRQEAGNWRVKYPERKEYYQYHFPWRFPPEQYFAIMALNKSGFDVKMHDWTDWNQENIYQSELFIMNNFIVLDFSRNGLYLPKYEQMITSNFGDSEYTEKGLYNFSIYSRAYETMFVKQKMFKDWDAEYHLEGV